MEKTAASNMFAKASLQGCESAFWKEGERKANLWHGGELMWISGSFVKFDISMEPI